MTDAQGLKVMRQQADSCHLAICDWWMRGNWGSRKACLYAYSAAHTERLCKSSYSILLHSCLRFGIRHHKFNVQM